MSGSSKLKNLHKVLYALPAGILALPTIPVFILLPSYYAESMGLGLAVVGSAFLGLRLLDVISDPILGWISDLIPSKYGKRKLPIAIGGLIGAPALIMIFTPSPDAGVEYLILWGAILFLAWTAIQIPYVSWAVELEHRYGARAQLNGLREGAGLLGIMGTGALGLFLAAYSEAERFQILAWVTVVLGSGVIFLALKFVPNGRFALDKTSAWPTFPWKNKLFLRVLTAWFINGLANGLPAVCLPLFMGHVLNASETDQATLVFVYFLFAVIGIQGWVCLAGIFSKHLVWCLSMALATVAFLGVPFLSNGDIIAFGVICAITGFALGGDLALPPAIQADCVDWDRYKFRQERTGSLFAYWSMSTKLALGLAVGFSFSVLAWFGLDDQTEIVSQNSKTALIVIYSVIPIVLKLLAIRVMWTFPIGSSQHEAIVGRLERRV
jgi:GPH family glycoside/pentoside/hexuronide:cation symporter